MTTELLQSPLGSSGYRFRGDGEAGKGRGGADAAESEELEGVVSPEELG